MAEENDPLELVRRRLYAAQPLAQAEEGALRRKRASTFFGWQSPAQPAAPLGAPVRHGMSFAAKFLIGCLVFFFLAGVGAAAFLIFGGRTVSSSHVNVLVQGPTTIASGDVVSLVVTVQNQNPVAMTNAQLAVDLPDGTKSPDNPAQALDHYHDTLGDIPSGQSVSRTVRAQLFGAQGQQLTIPVHVQYGTPNSNANNTKDASYAVTVTTSPINVNVSAVSEAASGQPFTVSVEVRSNAATALDNVALSGQYPPGFTPTSADPAPTAGSFFSIGTLQPGESRTVTVSGSLAGQENDQRAFTFTAGTAQAGAPQLAQPFTSSQVIVTIAKPFLGVTLSVDHQSTDTIVVPATGPVTALLSWANSLSVPVTNAQVAVKFSGNAFDPKGVSTQTGFYNSNTGTLLITKDTVPSLAALQPGDTGGGAFTLVPKTAGVSSPTVNVSITVSGTRASGGGTVSSTIKRTILVGSSAKVSGQIGRAAGDTGPATPTAGQDSTYTVALSAATTQNSIAGPAVSMQLPAYVTYTGKTSAGANITYDDSSRTVTWTVGDLTPGSTQRATFQVSFLPSVSQQGTSPVLVGTQTLSGTDRFTQAQVTASAPPLVAPAVH